MRFDVFQSNRKIGIFCKFVGIIFLSIDFDRLGFKCLWSQCNIRTLATGELNNKLRLRINNSSMKIVSRSEYILTIHHLVSWSIDCKITNCIHHLWDLSVAICITQMVSVVNCAHGHASKALSGGMVHNYEFVKSHHHSRHHRRCHHHLTTSVTQHHSTSMRC